MDEISHLPAQLASLLRTSHLFLEICHHQHIFITLFDFIGFQAFISLSASNSKLYQAINAHEQVQVRLLRRKINKLKQKEFKRHFPNIIWVDFNFFNPYTLPPYQKDIVQAESIENLDQSARENALVKAQQLRHNDLTMKREWGKWRAGKKAEQISGSKSGMKRKNETKQLETVGFQANVKQQKIHAIEKAEQILKLKMEMKEKILQEYPKAKNQLEEMRNRHFAQSILGQQLPKNKKVPKYSNLRQVKVQKSPVPEKVSTGPKLKNHDAWDFCIKQMVEKQIEKKKARDELIWKPISKTTASVKKGLNTILEAPLQVAQKVKNNITFFLMPSPN